MVHRASLLFLLSVILLAIGTGCTARVAPPARVDDPVTVYLVENAMHGGIVLPTTHDTVVQFDYGDYGYYAEDAKGCLAATYALFWPSPGTLARREIRGIPPDVASVRRRLWVDKALPLQVERTACRALLLALEERFRRQIASYTYDESLRTAFVRDARSYHLFQTCNHQIEEWLRRLGCEIDGWWWTWEFELVEPEDRADR